METVQHKVTINGSGTDGRIISIDDKPLRLVKSISFLSGINQVPQIKIEMIVNNLEIDTFAEVKINGVYLSEDLKLQLYEQLKKELGK